MSTTLEFKHQQVRDLAWVCFSPALFNYLPNTDVLAPPIHCSEIKPEVLNWLTAIDNNPQPLQQHLAELRSPRLGIYFEDLCSFFWQHFPGCQLHGQNWQVIQDNKTIGEFDFIVETDSRLYHLEVAVKFYLGIPDKNEDTNTSSQWHQWIGPNCNDRLDIKLHRLRDHQLQLSKTPTGENLLLSKGIATDQLNTCLQLQGYLFYPAHTLLSPPSHCNAAHLRGSWYHLNDFIAMVHEEENSHWMQIQKSDWISSFRLDSEHSNKLLSANSIQDYLVSYFSNKTDNNNIRPLLLTKMFRHRNQWHEESRSFIVPNNWPWNNYL